MRNALLVFLTGRIGRWGVPVLTAVVAAWAAKLQASFPEAADQVNPEAVASFAVAMILAAVNAWATKSQSDGVKQMQEPLQRIAPAVRVDGVAGPITQSATQGLAVAAMGVEVMMPKFFIKKRWKPWEYLIPRRTKK